MTSTSRPAPLHIKIVIDAVAPHAQADFWASALHYEVEDNSALIEKLLGFGAVPAELTVESHGRRAWRDLAAVRHPDDPFQEESGTGLGRRLLFQRVPEAKTVKTGSTSTCTRRTAGVRRRSPGSRNWERACSGR